MPKIKPLDKQNAELKLMFKTALVRNGWTQKHLAEICGMTAPQMSLIIRNPEKHNFGTVLIICRKLGIKELPVIR